MNDITDRRPKVDLDPGMGKSKLIRKWVKKFNKRRKKQGLPKLKITKLKVVKSDPSDLTGYLVPGVRHSPTHILDTWLLTRDEYREALNRPDPSIAECDARLADFDRAGTEVNKLFGSDMVDGVWDKSDE